MRATRAVVVASAVMLIPALAACGSSGSSASSSDEGPAVVAAGPTGGPGLVASWSLTAASVSSSDLSAYGITITFTDTMASGFGGVNQYTTTFTSGPEGDLDFGPIAGTRMAGPSDAMQAEEAYFATLDTVTGYTVSGDRLSLYANGQDVLIYARK